MLRSLCPERCCRRCCAIPLADPYVLGISGGAAVAALLALALGLPAIAVQAAAIGGALLTLMLLFLLARRALYSASAALGEQATGAVLLTGVMLASFAAALMSLVLSLAPDGRLRTMVFWLLGDLAGATHVVPALFILALVGLLLALARADARALNLMMRGDLQAFTQGVRVVAIRRRLILIAAVATASAVTLGGAVGFVGFVAPHLVRMVAGNDQRVVLPASMLLGGALVVTADTIARTAFAPLQLPVGVSDGPDRRAGLPLVPGATVMNDTELLAVRGLSLRTPQRLLVDSLDLTVRRGERWAVLGPNGAGKSTLLAAIAGARHGDGGEILLGRTGGVGPARGRAGARSRVADRSLDRSVCEFGARHRADGTLHLPRRGSWRGRGPPLARASRLRAACRSRRASAVARRAAACRHRNRAGPGHAAGTAR